MTGSLVLGLAALAAAIVLGCLAAATKPRAVGQNSRIASIEQYYTRGTRLFTEASVVAGPARLSAPLQWGRRLAGLLSAHNVLGKIQHRLDVAGNPGGWSAERVLAFKGVGLVALTICGALLGTHSVTMFLVLTIGGALTGFFLPDVLIYNTGLKRQEKLRRELPDALDMMTVCVEAGLGFDAALSQVARNTEGPLAAEFARVLQEMQFGKSRIEALRALTGRTTVPELGTFVTAVVQASELGIPIATVMREQSAEMRVRRRQRAEERAQKVTVKILFPLIFCLFPALMVVVMGPGALNIMRIFSHH